MKTFTVLGYAVTPGIRVHSFPYWRVVLGEGGNKKSTWIALGKKDASEIISERERVSRDDDKVMIEEGKVMSAGVITLKDKEGNLTGNHLIVKEKGNHDDRILIKWCVESGFRGSANIEGGQEVKIIANDHSWHSGQGAMGETAECMAILKPGQRLYAKITGRRVEEPRAVLEYDGKEIKVTYGKEDLETVLSDEQPEGEYV